MGIGNLVFAKMGYTSALKSPIFSLKCVNALLCFSPVSVFYKPQVVDTFTLWYDVLVPILGIGDQG